MRCDYSPRMARFERLASVGCFIGLAITPLSGAMAAPPPPPPSYVMDVANLLTHQEDATTTSKLSDYIADDVRTFVNDRLVTRGKADWLRYSASARPNMGRVLAFSADWRDDGSLMIVDEYDMVDRSKLPPHFLADPRMTSRATLYQFGPDQKIHAVRTLIGGGFWIAPKP